MNGTRGFTLVELLVAIVLVALASTLVMQGIGQGLGLVGRVTRDQGAAWQELMARGWLRDSVGAASALARSSEETGFLGTASSVSLSSFRPLLGSEGIASPIRWSADAEGRLVYTEQDQSVPILALPPLAYIEFQDAAGTWQASWPPAAGTEEESGASGGALPRRVRFVFAEDDTLELALPAASTGGEEEEGDFDDEGEDLGADDDQTEGDGPDEM